MTRLRRLVEPAVWSEALGGGSPAQSRRISERCGPERRVGPRRRWRATFRWLSTWPGAGHEQRLGARAVAGRQAPGR